ncbi:MAG TPA: hypothetical protein VFC93_07405 [Chloroflexota bacterium]|nr:hypothetical protein [Chloroflexota bacterium]
MVGPGRVVPLVLALVLASVAACAAGGPSAQTAVPYLSGPPGTPEAGLTPLDPASLADASGTAPLGAGLPIEPWSWTASADGSTLAGVDYDQRLDPARHTAVVLDARTGTERARFATPPLAVGARLSRDGSRLVMALPHSRVDPPATEWFTIDTRTGTILSRATVAGPLSQSWLDPAATRLYRVDGPTDGPMAGPIRLQLVANDLATGAELGRVELPDAGIGTWPVPTDDQNPAFATVSPGIALSPDGRTLVVLPAESDALVLVDTERMAVARRVDLGRPWSPLEWLPLWPRLAHAKEVEGTIRQALFGPDGRRLYAWGAEWRRGPDGRPVAHQLPLRAIDVASGRVVVEAALPEAIASLLPEPGGRSLYLVQPGDQPGPTGDDDARRYPYLLRRLDAATLAVRAEREVAGFRQLLLLPAG